MKVTKLNYMASLLIEIEIDIHYVVFSKLMKFTKLTLNQININFNLINKMLFSLISLNSFKLFVLVFFFL